METKNNQIFNYKCLLRSTVSKNCMKITKSTFSGRKSGDDMGQQAHFSSSRDLTWLGGNLDSKTKLWIVNKEDPCQTKGAFKQRKVLLNSIDHSINAKNVEYQSMQQTDLIKAWCKFSKLIWKLSVTEAFCMNQKVVVQTPLNPWTGSWT